MDRSERTDAHRPGGLTAERCARLLGAGVSVVTAAIENGACDGTDRLDRLDPAELAAVGQASAARRAEFAAGRVCAHDALAALGVAPAPILVGANREPLWPDGVVGSISHAGSACVAAVAPTTLVASLGIDLEVDAPLPDGVEETILDAGERAHVRGLPSGVQWETVAFSAKESVYKAWYPIERRWLGFEDVEVRFDDHGSFTASFRSDRPTVAGVAVASFAGRFDVADGLIVTAVRVPAPG